LLVETEPVAAGVSRVKVTILTTVAVVVGGFLAVVIPRAHQAAAFAQTINNLRAIGAGIQNAADEHDGYAPPCVGLFAEKEGTLFFHISPYIKEGDTTASERVGQGVRIYSSPSDPSFPEGKPWTSFASNSAVFAVKPQTLYNYDDFCEKKGSSNIIILMERFAVASGHVHAWGDTSEGATYLDGPATSVEYGVKPEQARDDTAHALTQWGCQVGLADGRVRKITQQMSPETFRWACNPRAETPPPSDW
jgi:hypothetical protein